MMILQRMPHGGNAASEIPHSRLTRTFASTKSAAPHPQGIEARPI
jgi:hypothetical protein